MRSIYRLALTSLFLATQFAFLSAAWGDSVGPHYLPPPQHEEAAAKLILDVAGLGNAFAGKTLLQLPYPKDTELDQMRENNARGSAGQAKALQIGFARDIPADLRLATSELAWVGLTDGRLAAQFSVVSPGAKAMRLGLMIKDGFSGELRFAGSGKPEQVFGPYRRVDWLGQAVYWSPLSDGEMVTVEIVLPAGKKDLNGDIEVVQVSHIVTHPTQGNQFANLVPTTASCEIDMECSTNSVVKDAAKGVARMLFVEGGKSYVCSGTLLNDKSSSQTPWFYTANHCISTQTTASTLNTFFFYENSGCYSSNVAKTYKQLTRGATYLDSSATNDHAFLRLNEAAPGGATFNAWNTEALVSNQTVVGIHHPHGDFKKVSSGSVGSPAMANIRSLDTGEVLNNLWQVTFSSGTTESGSSGSGLFYCTSSQCELRGGLFGGPAASGQECVDRRNSYSRFDVAYARISSYLNTAPTPTCTSPQILQNGQCVTPTPTCTSPQVLQNGQCVTPTPTCTSPQVLQNGQCVTPAPTCTSPQVLQNGQCVTPTPTAVPGATYSSSNGALTIKRLEVDAGVFGKTYYDVTMKMQANSNPPTLTVDTAVLSK